MESLKFTLLNNWHIMRIIRLGLGLIIGFQAIESSDWLIGLLAGLVLVQAVTNTGCAGGSCSVPTQRKSENLRHEN